AGSYNVAIACGVESMTRVPMGSSAANGPGKPFGPVMMRRYNDVRFNQGISAEMMAERWKLDRASLDLYSLRTIARQRMRPSKDGFAARFCPLLFRKKTEPRFKSRATRASVPIPHREKWRRSRLSSSRMV